MKTFNELQLHFLQDMYFAEQQIAKSMPSFATAAKSATVKQLLELQVGATCARLELLKQAFSALARTPQGVTCDAILGLLKECEDLLRASAQPSAIRDAGLVACVQAIQYYSLARYGALLGWATQGSDKKAIALLRQLLEQVREQSHGIEALASGEVAADASQAL